MKEVTDKELQLNTEDLLSRVVMGEALVVTIGEMPVARLVPRSRMSRNERNELLEALEAERSER